MASTNGFDIGGFLWMGKHTYSDIFDIVSKLYPRFSYDTLDKNYSYTIGFRHPEFHPLLTDGARMWFIQCCALDQANAAPYKIVTSASADIGIPIQMPSMIPELSPRDVMEWIAATNNQAMNAYTVSMKGAMKGSPYEQVTPVIHYGFILRSDTADIIMESDLMKTVRKLVYNLPKNNYRNLVHIDALDRLDYAVLRAFLSENATGPFRILFPQFNEKFKTYNSLFLDLSSKIISILRQRSPTDARPDDSVAPIDKLAKYFAQHIQAQTGINVMNASGQSIVIDFLRDRRYLDMYYSFLFQHKTIQ